MARPRINPQDSLPETPETPPLVKMERDPAVYPQPHTANVHPDEVKNYYSGGWRETE